MGFWDNVGMSLSMFCEEIRDTKIGAKILDDICDSIDRSEKRLHRFEEKVDILFMEDVQTEGKKRGYDRAAGEYEVLYRNLEKEYHKAIQLLSDQKLSKDEKFNKLITQLQNLEQERKKLEDEFRRDVGRASASSGVARSTIMAAFANSSSSHNLIYEGSLIDLLCSGKEKKFRKAEAAGYKEAKELFTKKLNKKKAELEARVNAMQSDLSQIANLIQKVLYAITEEETKITELRILVH